jgi:hypothetical protein
VKRAVATGGSGVPTEGRWVEAGICVISFI